MIETLTIIILSAVVGYVYGRTISVGKYHAEAMTFWKAECIAATFRERQPTKAVSFSALSDLELVQFSRVQRLTMAAAELRQAALNSGTNVIELRAGGSHAPGR